MPTPTNQPIRPARNQQPPRADRHQHRQGNFDNVRRVLFTGYQQGAGQGDQGPAPQA
jgi:hypothetical protein